MANQYRFLPDFSVFENDEQNDVSTEGTNSSIMSRNRQVDTDTSGTGGDFLERFYQNLRGAFKDDDKFKQTFMSNKRPKPDISELRSYVDRVKGSRGIEDALLEATGMYNPGMASDDNSITIQDASDGITIPKQPDVMVDELSSSLGSYLRNRTNKGSSFVGEGVQMASAGSLSVEDMDLARMMAGQTMKKEAAEMGLPVVDMEEEERKALEFAKTIPKLSTIKGEGLMSPVSSDPRVDMAASGLNEDDPLGRVRPKARPEVETAEALTDDDMGLPESRSETEKLIAFEPLFSFIEKGEGGYEASNRGTLNNSIVGSTNSTERDGKSLTEMTIAEIREKQAITDANNPERLFAVGRFQVIPSTLEMAIDALDLSDDTVFSEGTQNKIGMYLVSEKRRNVGRYLRGEGDVSRDTAMLELAKEFASMPVPYDMTVKRGGKDVKIKKGDSYYGSGNKAQHSYAEVKKQLEKLKGTV